LPKYGAAVALAADLGAGRLQCLELLAVIHMEYFQCSLAIFYVSVLAAEVAEAVAINLALPAASAMCVLPLLDVVYNYVHILVQAAIATWRTTAEAVMQQAAAQAER
jgi:hypothetical protein